MAEYSYIKSSFWTDPENEKLPPEAKLVFLYLISNPLRTQCGIYKISPNRIAYDTGYSIDTVSKAIDALSREKKIKRDGLIIWIVNFFKHQANSSPKVLKRVAKELEELGNHPYIKEFLEKYKDYNIPYGYHIDTISKGYPKKEKKKKRKEKENKKKKENRKKKINKTDKEKKEEILPVSLPEDIIQFKEFFNTTLSEDIRNSILDSLRNIFRKKSFRSARQLEMLKDIFEEEGFDARAVDATLKHIVKIKQHHWLFNYGPPAYDRFVKSWNELKHFKPFIVKPEDIPDGFPSKEALFDFLDKFCENDKQVREVIKIMKYHKGMEDAWQMYEEYKRRQV